LDLGSRKNITYQFCGFILSLKAAHPLSGSLKEKDSPNLLLLAHVGKILITQRGNSVGIPSVNGSGIFIPSCLVQEQTKTTFPGTLFISYSLIKLFDC